MSSRFCVAVIAALSVVALASDARADIIFSTGQGDLQPAEQLLFNAGETTGNPVQGHTSDTDTLFDVYSNETLTANGGQARVSAPDGDGTYTLFYLEAHDPSVVFSQFEANINIEAKTSGTATVTACNQSGNFDGADYSPLGANMIGDGGPCEQFSYAVDAGSNFFVLSVADSQLLTGVKISTDVGIVDVRQIRLSPLTSGGDPVTPTPVPEPASLMLLGSGLLVGAKALRRRTA